MTQHWHTSWRFGLGALALASAALAGAQSPQVHHHHGPQTMHQPDAAHHHKARPVHTHRAAMEHQAPDSIATDYERNALRRCEVFKTAEDHAACVARVHQPLQQDSVDSGGVLRQSVQTMPAHPMQHPPMPPSGQ